MITINMSKAVEIQKNRVRVIRNAQLVELDVQYMRALESDDTAAQATIAAQKQKLRDAPASALFTSAQTSDELKAVTLEAILAANA